MNPRLFCRERTFHKALLLTYSFDPIFFEQVVLPDLWNGRTGDILVIGDREQVLDSTSACAGRLWHLGRSYLLAPANHRGAFHPKVIVRLGASDGAVMIGSGNLTSAGWGGNQELGTGWLLGPGHADDGAWLHSFFADVMSWCSSDLERDAIARMRDVPWLSLTAAAATSNSVLHSRRDTALAPLLLRRWAGRRFDSVRILTGSTDESGAFLRWAYTEFGIRRAVIALTPSSASFDPKQLADLPIELVLVEASPDRPMHAKFYWFEGEQGAAAIMGSANCSAAAWLLPPARGGNIETVVVYDSANSDAYQDVLRIFDAPTSTAQELCNTKTTPLVEPQTKAAPFCLLGLRWDKDSFQITAFIEPCPTPDHTVQLLLGARTVMLSAPAHSNDCWACSLSEEPDSGTSFGCVRVTRGSESWTASRWIDDLLLLRHASLSVRLLEPFKSLERDATSGEQRQMLVDLQEVAHALFDDASAFRDPGAGNGRETTAEGEQRAGPVNPNDLICHLDEGSSAMSNLGGARSAALSFTGILRMLFDAEGDESGAPIDADDGQLDEGGEATGGEKTNRIPKPESRERVTRPIEGRFRERLAAQISTFLERLRSVDFSDHCSATQMVQAVAFPLAVALRGQKRGWVSQELAEVWGLAVISILFHGSGQDCGGLLHVVERRYENSERREIFDEVVGDGTLWMILVATLGGSRWHGPGAYLDKAIALREVFSSRQLLASARPERIVGLLGKVRIEDARKFLAYVAPKVTELLTEIETKLRPIWNDEAKVQTEQKITHKTSDLLWRDHVGWAVCLEDNALRNNIATCVRLEGKGEIKIAAGFYVNVSQLAFRDMELCHQLEMLRSYVDSEVDA